MRSVLLICAVLAILALVGLVVLRSWWGSQFPPVSTETVSLTPAKRTHLEKLRGEHKFQPHDYPPLGYTGAETPEDESLAVSSVNGVIDGVLAKPNGPIAAKFVSDLIGKEMRNVKWLATEDRDRTQDYMVEVWYILGFKGAIGRFAYGSYYVPPEGYAEPLPSGWTSPDQPRTIH